MEVYSRRQFIEFLAAAGAGAAALGVAGCASGGQASSAASSASGAGSSAGASSSSASAASASASSASSAEVTLTDAAGRTVTMPTTINKVYCAIPTAEALAFALAPEKMVGVVNEISDNTKKYVPATEGLPVLGGWMGQVATANMEAIISAAPDLILYCYGSSSANADVSNYASAADQIQSDAGVPVYVFDGNLAKTPEAFRTVGKLLGVPDRGEELAAYVEDKLEAVAAAVAKVPADEVVTCYYAEGEGGLATDPAGSSHTQVIDWCNVDNIAVVDGFAGPKGQGMIEVSMEEVISWNPQMILVAGSTPANYDLITTDSAWAEIDAVKNGKVYQTPIVPFGWFDRPPNTMRVLGCQWFANLVYPDYYKADARADIKEFFELFYGSKIDDEGIDAILAPNPTLA